jgi:tetratricopeptide (TPR) repeat protein
MRTLFFSCAAVGLLGWLTPPLRAQHLPPYNPAGASGQKHREERAPVYGSGGGRFYGGPPRDGISYPGYWTYNRFSNLGFGGLGWYYGPLGGYTPYITTPYANASFGYPNFGPYYSYVPLAPVIRQSRPWNAALDPPGNPGAGNAGGNPPAAARQVPPQPLQDDVAIFKKQPTADAMRRSVRYQAQGDDWFLKQNYLQAYGHYKQAVSATPGRAEPRFRMALALAATRNYATAIDEMKRAMRIDPTWPRTGVRLDELFGADNILSKNAVLHKLASWVGEDIRDPDRLFLMGVLLHFNDNIDKSRVFFEAAFELSRDRAYAKAFLDAEADQQAQRPADEPRPGAIEDDEARPAAVPPGPAIPGIPARKQPEEPRPRPLADAGATGPAPRAYDRG